MSFPGRHTVQRAVWHLVDAASAASAGTGGAAQGQTVGRLAQQVATLLRGKHKPTFRRNKDCGDYVVIINADQVHLTGKKWDQKVYRHHTGYPGGLKSRTAAEQRQRHPTQILRKAILGMLRNTTLRQSYMEKRLKIYAGPDHPHTAQLPSNVEPVPPAPDKRNGRFGFGIVTPANNTTRSAYADPNSSRQGTYEN